MKDQCKQHTDKMTQKKNQIRSKGCDTKLQQSSINKDKLSLRNIIKDNKKIIKKQKGYEKR